MQPRRSAQCAAVALLAALPAAAAEVSLPGDMPELQIHGFLSQGYLLSSSNNYLAANTTEGSFEFSEAGLNLSLPLTDRLRIGMQLFSRQLGPIGDFKATFDWYGIDYHWRDWLGVRAGRVKLPFGLYNDTSDIDAARTAILLPQSVYPTQNRDFLLAQTGVELYGFGDLGKAGALDYRGYAGTIFLDKKETRVVSPVTLLNLDVRYVVGGRLLWQPMEGLRVGGSLQALRLDTQFSGVPGITGVVELETPVTLWVASAEYALRELMLSAEYSRWMAHNHSNIAAFNSPTTSSERGYAMATYRFAPWFQAGGYWSLYFPDADKRGPAHDSRQDDFALTARFDVNRYWLVKLEGHYLHGTAGLDTTLNDNLPLATLGADWALFAVKTTAYF